MDKQTNGLKDIPLYHFDKHYGPRDGPKDRGTDVPSYRVAIASSKNSLEATLEIGRCVYELPVCQSTTPASPFFFVNFISLKMAKGLINVFRE